MFANRVVKALVLREQLRKCTVARATYSTAQLDISTKADTNPAPEGLSWENALPFEKIPGPSKWALVARHLPGGKYYKKTVIDIFRMAHEEYGNLVLFPGMFGRRDFVITYDPKDFQKVFRTEGQWPIRNGADSVTYYRTVERADFYKHSTGLAAAQGEDWAKFRTKVNPIMMQPKTVKLYVPRVDEVTQDFVQRIRSIKDPTTKEVPANFEEEIQHWALESIGIVALDTRLNLINEFSKDSGARKIIEAVQDFFELMYKLDVKPSLWKVFATPNFKKFMKVQDTLVEICSTYIDEAMQRIKDGSTQSDYEKGVLEKLLQVDKQTAIVMAMDMMMAGIDTTSSAFVACLFQIAKNPEKQHILREELKTILPHKDSHLTNENMKNLPYLRACIKEALRIYPVTIGNFRTTGQNLVLSGYQIPKGFDVSMASMVLQRDDAYFPKALKFLPERWLRNSPENSECPSGKTAHPFIYLPFGFGPRMCIGKRFVDLELEVALSRIIRNFRVEYNHPDMVIHTNVINYLTGDFRFKFVELDE